ncbi:hypothetical protein KI387_039265, partial [Taxus chinensis]
GRGEVGGRRSVGGIEGEAYAAGMGVAAPVVGAVARATGEIGLAAGEPIKGGAGLGEEGRLGYLRRQHL